MCMCLLYVRSNVFFLKVNHRFLISGDCTFLKLDCFNCEVFYYFFPMGFNWKNATSIYYVIIVFTDGLVILVK